MAGARDHQLCDGQGALDLGLPGEGVDDFVEVEGGLHCGEYFAARIRQLEVGDQSHRISHSDYPTLKFDPIPRNARCAVIGRVTPYSLATARVIIVTHVEHARAKMYKMEFRRALGLPQ